MDGRRPRRGARRRARRLVVADRIAADPAPRRAGRPEGARRRPGAAEGLLGLGAGAAAARAARARRARRPGRPTRASTTTVSVALVPGRHPALVPGRAGREGRRRAARGRRRARVVGLEARAYRGVQTGDSVLDIYAIPTTRGVLTLVCAARSGGRRRPPGASNGLDQITVGAPGRSPPNAGTAYRMRAPAAMKGLDAVRVRERVALRRAKGPVGQERAARTLWRAYGDGRRASSRRWRRRASRRRRSSPRCATPRAPTGKLGDAAEQRSKRGWARARSAVAKAEKTLKRRLAAA